MLISTFAHSKKIPQKPRDIKDGLRDLYVAKNWEELFAIANDDKFKIDLKRDTQVVNEVIVSTMAELYDKADEAIKAGDQEQSYVSYYRFLNIVRSLVETEVYDKNADFYDNAIGLAKVNEAAIKMEQLTNSLQERYSAQVGIAIL